MQAVADCIPCYLNQTLNTIKKAQVDDRKAQRMLNALLPQIAKLNSSKTPAENSSIILKDLYRAMENGDPFDQAKRESNRLALSMLPEMRRLIAESEDPLHTALQVSAAGNIIDMGILPDYDVEASLKEALTRGFDREDYQAFRLNLQQAERVLILCDNSGEIAFDRLLAEQISKEGKKVVCAVKAGPILNDATLEDAREVGLTEVAKVITNGSELLGTVLSYCSPEFHQELAAADLVISKGQANYESLESTKEAGQKTFFLLRAKCPIVAKSLKENLGAFVFAQNKRI